MKKGVNKFLRIVLLFVVVMSSITIVNAQDPGGPLDPNAPDTTFPVPVKSIALTATRSTQKVNITWNTLGESQVASFVIEKSTNGKVFTVIYTVSAKNTASATYSFVDESSVAAYYRVKATDKNGAFTFSAVKYVAGNSDLKFNVFPIPLAGNTLHIATSSLESSNKYAVSIFNTLGKKVFDGQLDSKISLNELYVGKLAAGTYNMVIKSNGLVVYTKSIEVLN
jgi:hypothetical protein